MRANGDEGSDTGIERALYRFGTVFVEAVEIKMAVAMVSLVKCMMRLAIALEENFR